MALTAAQYQALKTFILADPTLSAQPMDGNGNDTIQIALNAVAAPDFWVWKSFVTDQDIYSQTTADGTSWSWPAFIARSQGERDGWREMVNMAGGVNPSLANVRQGIADIFSGSTNSAPAQRTHLLTIGRRKATVAEKLFATGTGSTATPATMGFEGTITDNDVDTARHS